MRAMIPAVALLSALSLTACGIKGPLFIPEKPQPVKPSPADTAGNDSKPDFNPTSIPTPNR